VLLGYLFGRTKKIDLTAITSFIIYISTPCLITSSLAEKPIDIVLSGKIFLATLGVVGGSLAVGYLTLKISNLSIKVYLPPILFANTGNMGLPLVLFAFGDEGFSIGILYMVAMTILHYTLGIAILSFDRDRLEIFKLPLIYAALGGIIISVFKIELPPFILRPIGLLGDAAIPLMIFALGYKLSEITISSFKKSFFFGSLRIILGFFFGIAVARLLGLVGVSWGVVVLDSSMPPAVFNFVLAERYTKESEEVASIILAGTVVSVVTTPLIIAYIL